MALTLRHSEQGAKHGSRKRIVNERLPVENISARQKRPFHCRDALNCKQNPRTLVVNERCLLENSQCEL
jgi:hypothetical protein